MQNSERQIALVKDVEVRLWHSVTYDMYLTDKRMILIHTKRLKSINSALYWGFLVGAFILISEVESVGVHGLIIGIPAIFIGIVIGYSVDRFITPRRKEKENEMYTYFIKILRPGPDLKAMKGYVSLPYEIRSGKVKVTFLGIAK